MDGFLVIGRCCCDDVPVRLCASMDEAETYAADLTPQDVKEAADSVMNVGVSDVIAIAVVTFANGRPGYARSVKDFDEAFFESYRLDADEADGDED